MGWFEIWLTIAIVGAITEMLTTQLISIWFTVSAIINLFLVIAHVSFQIQLWQFFISGILLAIVFRPIVLKLLPKFQPLNTADGIIGKKGVVIDNQRVKVDGQSWKYDSDQSLEIGDEIKVIDLSGVTLKVEKLSKGID
ncbi:NfeD family protein [Ligilactobacillus cholophilus]|uniref:NfeD family protein n=1 Tax=Ligilactobacillus cholophilus TaxID=3050131 RepID=UPI0025B0A4C3|nr:NfeD family protein [Ligilactobacillus cholophilus]